MPARISGMRGDLDRAKDLALAEAHPSRRIDDVAVDLANGDIRVGQDRRDRKGYQGEDGRPEAESESSDIAMTNPNASSASDGRARPMFATLIAMKPARPV